MSARLPGWSQDLELQTFPGVFDYCDLKWTPVQDNGHKILVAKVSHDGYKRFLDGEMLRGKVNIIKRERKGSKGNLLLDCLHECCRGSHSHASQAAKALAGVCVELNDENAPPNAPRHRRSKIQMGQSIKVGCCYAFRAKCYASDALSVLLKFQPGQMEHRNEHGELAHDGSASNRPISVECREFVFQRLLLRAAPNVILEGEPMLCLVLVNVGSFACWDRFLWSQRPCRASAGRC